MPKSTTGDRGEAIALAILAAAMVVAVLALLYWGRDQVLAGDDLFYAQRLAENSLGHVILHSNLYLIALPMALYKAMFELFGIGSTLPYRLVAIALSLLSAGLFYAIARRRIGGPLALAPTILILFFGSGGEELLTGARLPSLIAIASGLGAILALERDDRRGDVGAAGLLCISATSHPTGLGFLVAAAVMIAWRPPPGRWRSAWVVLLPVLLVGAFLLFYQRTADTPHQGISDVLSFERASWTMLTAAVSGLSDVLDAPVWDRPLAELASGALLLVIVVGAALRWRRLQPTFWAAAAGLIGLIAATRLSPGGFVRVPDAPRYLYPEAILFLWLLVELGAAWRQSGTAGVRAAVAGAVTVVLLLGLWSNVAKLDDAGSSLRASSALARGEYSAYDLERDRVNPSYTVSPFLPTAGDYLAASDAYGSMGLGPDQLATASQTVRAYADLALVGALGLAPTAASGSAPAPGRAPRVVRLLGGTAKAKSGCVELRPVGSASVAPSPTPLAELELPAGGAWIDGRDLGGATLRLARFAAPPVARLRPFAGSGPAVVRTPSDRVPVPWRLQVDSSRAITVCGLAPYRVTGSS